MRRIKGRSFAKKEIEKTAFLFFLTFFHCLCIVTNTLAVLFTLFFTPVLVMVMLL